ncbi:DJ-1/PfpI family protein [Serratia aquatilis]|uniref:DJ-1/PfpI family protein n=1 Tax=Serratia aquatilis TaxID=1737515 RepID=A0ABV6E921_9GAMM
MQKRTVLFVLISDYADWEPALLAASLKGGFGLWNSEYEVKTVSICEGPVTSIGGFTIAPDYTIDRVPKEFAALILVGGTNWHGEEAEKVIPLLNEAVTKKIIVGAICDASLFLAKKGYLNDISHTFIELSVLNNEKKGIYSGEKNFVNGQSVRDGNIITAKPTGYVEFTRDVLLALNVAPEDRINTFYTICKTGDCSILLETIAR